MTRVSDPLALSVVLCTAVACQSRSASTRAAPGEAGPTEAEAAATAAAGPAGSEAAGAGDSTPPAGSATGSAGPSPDITLSLANQTAQVRYTDFGRSPFDHVKVERFEAGQWTRVTYREPYCSEPCPADVSRAKCDPCSPAMPRPDWLEPKQTVTHTWHGEAYSTEEFGGACHCHRQQPVAHGRYRASVCVRPLALCGTAPCSRKSRQPPSLQGEPICAQREFQHDGQDQTVVLTISK